MLYGIRFSLNHLRYTMPPKSVFYYSFMLLMLCVVILHCYYYYVTNYWNTNSNFFFFVALQPNEGYGLLSHEVFLDHTQWRTTVGRTPLDEWSTRHRDFYLITHKTHNRQTSMPLAGFEPTIAVGKWPQTYALHHVATGTGIQIALYVANVFQCLRQF